MAAENLRAGFIGGGALAESVIRGISGKLMSPEDIFVSERNPERCEYLREKYKINATSVAENFLGGQAERRGSRTCRTQRKSKSKYDCHVGGCRLEIGKSRRKFSE